MELRSELIDGLDVRNGRENNARRHRSETGDERSSEPAPVETGEGTQTDAESSLPGSEESQAPPRQSFVALDALSATRVEWLMPDRIPLGAITLLEGDPGTGKSSLTCDLIARVTSGRSLPGTVESGRQAGHRPGGCCPVCGHADGDRSARPSPRGVVLIQAEDHLNATVIPRLVAAGADLSRIRALDGSSDGEPWKLKTGIPALQAAIQETAAALVVIDPLPTFLSTASHSDQKVREELQPLASLAERTGAAILIVRHLVKETGRRNVAAGAGSIAIIGQARAALAAGPLPDEFSSNSDVVPFFRSADGHQLLDGEADDDSEDDSREELFDPRFTHLLSLIKSNLGAAPPLVYRTRKLATGAVTIDWLGTYEPGRGGLDDRERDAVENLEHADFDESDSPALMQQKLVRRSGGIAGGNSRWQAARLHLGRAWNLLLSGIDWSWAALWEYGTRLSRGAMNGAARGIKRGRSRRRRR